MPVGQAFAHFQAACTASTNFITRAHTQDPTTHAYLLSADERDLVTVAAFLRLFIAWETYVEETFLLYMQGTPSRTAKVVGRYVLPTDKQHARKMIVGTQRFVDWSTPDIVKILSPLAFHAGEPFSTALSGCHQDLLDLKTIRNATAHVTTTTQAALDSLANRRLGHHVTNITVSTFLLKTDPASAPPKTIFQCYVDILLTAATVIADA